jgi:RimJ/RimL family protein N-acetyltransferase
VKLRFRPLGEDDAQAIVDWRYEDPYSIYDAGPDEVAGMLAPENRYYAIAREDDPLIGFCCFGPDARVRGGSYDDEALDIGVGLRPDLTGGGMGAAFIESVLDFGRQEFAPAGFRATVAAFNKRSLRACETAGFERIATFAGTTPKGKRDFVVLIRPAG